MEAVGCRLCRTLFWKNPSGGQEGGGRKGCGCRGLCGGPRLRRCRNEGLGSGSLTRPLVFTGRPSSQLGPWGPRFRKQVFFFSSVLRCFVCSMDLKGKQDFSQLLAANKPHQEIQGFLSSCCMDMLWGAEGSK